MGFQQLQASHSRVCQVHMHVALLSKWKMKESVHTLCEGTVYFSLDSSCSSLLSSYRPLETEVGQKWSWGWKYHSRAWEVVELRVLPLVDRGTAVPFPPPHDPLDHISQGKIPAS